MNRIIEGLGFPPLRQKKGAKTGHGVCLLGPAGDLDSAFCELVEFGSTSRGRFVSFACWAGVGCYARGGNCVASVLVNHCGVKQEGDAAFGG